MRYLIVFALYTIMLSIWGITSLVLGQSIITISILYTYLIVTMAFIPVALKQRTLDHNDK